MNFTYKFKRVTWRNTILTISSRLGETGTVQSVIDPLPTALLYQLLCPALRTNGNRSVAFSVCSPVLFAGHVFFMKTEAQISCCTIALRVRNRTWGWGGGGWERRERWRDKLCANRSYDLGQRYKYWFRTLSLLGISDWGVTPYFRPENVILHTLFQTYPASRGFSLAWLLSITKSFASLVSLVVGLSQERRTKQNNYATDGERFRKR